MKIRPILLLCTAVLCMPAFAQKIKTEKVPTAVTSAFNSRFPTATDVKWEMENSNEYEAEFKINGTEKEACFDVSGNWIETEVEIKESEIPQAIKDALKKEYTDFQIKEAYKVEHAQLGNCYEIEVKKGNEKWELYYHEDGTLLKKMMEEKKENDKDKEKKEDKKY